jgi:hypothetical protein
VEKRRAAARAKKAGRGRGRGRGTDQGGGRGRGRTSAAQQPPETEGIVAAGTKFKKVFEEGTFEGIVLSALEQTFIDRGHILIMSPKGHPELAGKGIEFSWGVGKKYFIKINKCKGKDLHDNTHTSFTVLDLPQARRNSPRTRRCRAACDTVGKSEGQLATSFALVEKFCKDHKAHRNILDQDTKEIKAVLARNGITTC